MTHTIKRLEQIEKVRLAAVLVFLLTWLKATHPRIYKKAEAQLHLSSARTKGKQARKTRTKSTKRATPAQMRARRKFKAFIKRHGRAPHKGERL